MGGGRKGTGFPFAIFWLACSSSSWSALPPPLPPPTKRPFVIFWSSSELGVWYVLCVAPACSLLARPRVPRTSFQRANTPRRRKAATELPLLLFCRVAHKSWALKAPKPRPLVAAVSTAAAATAAPVAPASASPSPPRPSPPSPLPPPPPSPCSSPRQADSQGQPLTHTTTRAACLDVGLL